jgi:NAD(P) transhydrogenase subunit alpha
MKVAVLKEVRADERRVAASPETVKKMRALGLDVVVESGAGTAAAISDQAFQDAGAVLASDRATALSGADVVLAVQRPELADLPLFKEGATLIGLLAPHADKEQLKAIAARKVSAFSLELLPRITRAQSMDVLSSQSNLAGYRAVIDAAYEFGRAFPMMMTAAGTVPPARVCVIGAGVAGLQAIATAKRLGAIVSAFDVRAAVKEQVQSLGATFIEVDEAAAKSAETAGGYAKEMSEEYKQKQAAKLAETLKKQDIVICTALIPGRPAPVIVTEEMVRDMKPGSVIVDLAVEQGGNCPLSEKGKVVIKHGVKLVGHLNVPSRIAVDASALYARNVLTFLTPLVDKETKALKIDRKDEIIAATLLTEGGTVVHPSFAG